MDDFLHNLRKNSERSNFEKRNKTYNNPQYRGPERRGARDQQRRPFLKRNEFQEVMTEIAPEIKSLIVSMEETQKRMLEAIERNADAQERQADIMESIGGMMRQLLEGTSEAPFVTAVSQGAVSREDNEGPHYQASSSIVEREAVIDLIIGLRQDGMTYKEIAQHLEDENIPTFSGKGAWHAQTVHKVCKQEA
jgi:Recombinase